MGIPSIAKQVRLRYWAEIINERQSSGQTVKKWCAENKISTKTYYYRLRCVRMAIIEGALTTQDIVPNEKITRPKQDVPSFAEICPSLIEKPFHSRPAIVINMRNNILEINNGAAEETILYALKAVKSIC
jgi:hypothetical protein